jgi:hypothetical protein
MPDTHDEPKRDLVEGRADPTVGMPTVAVFVLVVLVAVGAFLVGRSTSDAASAPISKKPGVGSPQAMTGEMVLSPAGAADVDAAVGEPAGPADQMSGTITLDAGGRHSGVVHLRGSTSTLQAATSAKVYHGWGAMRAVLDDTPCTGTYAWTYLAGPAQDEGSVHLRCKDGRVLAGRLTVVSADVAAPGAGTWRVGVRVDDGFYLTP